MYCLNNGVIWATRNVGESGTFVANPEDYGNYFNWDDAQKACPKGWRLPTNAEFESFSKAIGNKITKNGVKGQVDVDGTVFLPFAGYSYKNLDGIVEKDRIGSDGDFWSSTANLFIFFGGYNKSTPNKLVGFSVRCVAE